MERAQRLWAGFGAGGGGGDGGSEAPGGGCGLVRALGQAVRAPFACSGILSQRRPDVVLGGGGYVAGPMVLAARLRGIPAALTEAGAHLGRAHRLAAPRPR